MILEQIVRVFFKEVWLGCNFDYVDKLMIKQVLVYQVVFEEEVIVNRIFFEYVDYVREMIQVYGEFLFEIQELIVQGDKVYVCWR